MSDRSVNVPPEFERAVLERVRSGKYGSTDDVCHAALRALEFVEEHGRNVEALRRELQEAAEEAARESLSEDEVMQWVRERLREDDDGPEEANPV
jgi:putative addiction module CopG family antidote